MAKLTTEEEHPMLADGAEDQPLCPEARGNSEGEAQHEGTRSEEEGANGTIAATINIANAIIGGGSIAISYALKQTGFPMGLAALFLSAVANCYTLNLLVKIGFAHNATTYQELMTLAFGRTGFFVITLLQFLNPFVACISYNVAIGDLITKVIMVSFNVQPGSTILVKREVIIIAVTVLITFPLSLRRKVKNLAITSLMALVCILTLTFTVYWKRAEMEDLASNIKPDHEGSRGFVELSKAFSIYSFAFVCHHNAFLIARSMKKYSDTKWMLVSCNGVFGSFLIFLVLGYGGYATFGERTEGNILNNYCWSDTMVNVCRVVFCFVLIFTYPIECIVSRVVMETTLFGSDRAKSEENKSARDLTLHVTFTLFLVTMITIFTLLTNCFGLVVELNGYLTAIPVASLLPCLIALKLEERNLLHFRNFINMAIVIAGCTIMATGLMNLLIEGGDGCLENKPAPYCAIVDKMHYPWENATEFIEE